MTKVIILGAGSLAAEIHEWLALDNDTDVKIIGFYDPEGFKVRMFGLPVYRELPTINDVFFIIGIGAVDRRKEAVSQALASNFRPLTYIHNSALVAPSATIGSGVFIGPNCSVAAYVQIADFIHINVSCAIGHDVAIASHTILLGSNTLNGFVAIGESCTIGSGAIIHPGVQIASGCTVGIGSVVIRNIPQNITVFGNPAQKL